ncbi:MAG: hypothetical protein ACREHG_05795 [Candidatus Saccharimonadales bacterium]
MPLDAYTDSWRCSCGEIFRSEVGFAICPNSEIWAKVVRVHGNSWGFDILLDGRVLTTGFKTGWQPAFNHAFNQVRHYRDSRDST